MDWERQRQSLGQNIRTKRKDLGLSQERLALDAYVDRTYLRKVESGLCNPSMRIIRKVAAKLKTNVHKLVSPNKPKRTS